MNDAKLQALRVAAKLRGQHLDYLEYQISGRQVRRYLSPVAKTAWVPRRATEVWYCWDTGQPEHRWGKLPFEGQGYWTERFSIDMSRDDKWVASIKIRRRSR